MIIKMPLVIDISHWENVVDFAKLSPRPVLIITKATEGASFVDNKFGQFFFGIKNAGIARGCYHFYRKAYNSVQQAEHFVDTIKNYVNNDDILVLDVEEGGETVAQLQDFIQTTKNVYPNNLFMIYSRKNILDSIKMTEAQKEFFRDIPIWTAGYPLNPDLYSSPPESYIPDQTKYGPVWLWQYSDTGFIDGIDGRVDLNWIHQNLYKIIGGNSDEAAIEYFFQGKVEITHRYKSEPRPFYFHIAKFKKSDVERVHVNGGGFLGTVEYFWKTRGQPHLVINGDEGWYERSPIVPKGLGISDGNIYRAISDETNVQWDKDHQIIGMSAKPLAGVFNACGGSNILLKDGVIPSTLDNIHVDPRTSVFWDDDYYYIIMIDGRNNGTQGLTRKELAEFALSMGAKYGHNNDGGDSSALLVNDNGVPVIKNNPPDGKLHSVVNHIGFWFKQEPEGETNVNYKILKTVRKRPKPSMYSESPLDAPGGYGFYSETTKTVTESIDGKSHIIIWVQLPEDSLWVPMEYKGVVYVESVDVVPPPPTQEWPEYFYLENPDGQRTRYNKEEL